MIPASPVDSVSSLGRDRGSRSPRTRCRRWGLALAGLSSVGLVLASGAAAKANDLCEVGGSIAAQSAIPGLSDSFAQDVCQVLTLPTNSRSEGDAFWDQVRPDSIVTHTSASAETMTLPSMWWTRDSLPPQLGRHRLVDAWVSYGLRDSEMRVMDVMINGQFWRALTMPQRYGVLNSFGNSAQEFGYHLRFFQNNGYSARLIGLYACEAQPSMADETTHRAGAASCLVTVDTPQILQLQQAMQRQPERPIVNDSDTSATVAMDSSSQVNPPTPQAPEP